MAVLERAFYMRSALEAAPALLGKLMVHVTDEGVTAGMIAETEAYMGPWDDGAHSYGGRRTERTSVQYGPGGFAYVFSIYGMHCCFNAVTAEKEKPEVVLVRALEPVKGIELMKKRRGTENIKNLCSGPGKLCAALGITKAQYGLDLSGDELFIQDYRDIPEDEIAVSPRINIDYAEKYRDAPWRFYIDGSPFVSKVPGRFKKTGTLDKTDIRKINGMNI